METKRMKIGFYNPYFDVPSGGERYTLTLASHWSPKHDVSLFWDDPAIVGLSEQRFGLDLTGVRVVPNIFRNANIFGKLWESRKYDLIFFLSDGSIPMSLARRNILHFQVPFPSVLIDPMKMNKYDAIVCNSRFTKRELDPRLGEKAMVIYPPVQRIEPTGNRTKKKRIISVGRFTGATGAKKQDIMISAFTECVKRGFLKDWELVLAGALIPSDQAYFDRLSGMVSDMPVRLLPNISNEEMADVYRTGRIYWHAAGFGVSDPTQMEHFGITTVEAMSTGLVPIVFGGGGQLEIVSDGVNGFLWQTTDELIGKTKGVVRDEKTYSRISAAAMRRAEDFSVAQFTRAYDALISGWPG